MHTIWVLITATGYNLILDLYKFITTACRSLSIVGNEHSVDLVRCKSEMACPGGKVSRLLEPNLEIQILVWLISVGLGEIHALTPMEYQRRHDVVSQVRRHRESLYRRFQREDDQLTVVGKTGAGR